MKNNHDKDYDKDDDDDDDKEDDGIGEENVDDYDSGKDN
jgi:hypothetical protein